VCVVYVNCMYHPFVDIVIKDVIVTDAATAAVVNGCKTTAPSTDPVRNDDQHFGVITRSSNRHHDCDVSVAMTRSRG